MTYYFAIKHLHVACVILSGTGFFLRGFLMFRNASPPRSRWIAAAPHVNDTVLLAAALALMVLTHQYPFVDAWVTAKVFGLVAYIILGSVALKAGRTQRIRIAAWLAALAVFAYVVSVALTKNPWGFVRLFGG
ncbi:MAG: regulator SirB [Rhodocyclales bacterium GWA2_65_20]|nr:MAG: regulator SirB [Rhodocyclales bacterium GWA2_65_20]